MIEGLLLRGESLMSLHEQRLSLVLSQMGWLVHEWKCSVWGMDNISGSYRAESGGGVFGKALLEVLKDKAHSTRICFVR